MADEILYTDEANKKAAEGEANNGGQNGPDAAPVSLAPADESQDQTAQAAPSDQPAPTVPGDAKKVNANKSQGVSAVTGLPSAMAATGGLVKVPKTPDEVAKQGTALGMANDHASGGDLTRELPGFSENPGVTRGKRIWAMDNDHTTNNRNDFDPLKPDCSEVY